MSNNLIFVYGSLKKGFDNSHKLADSKYLGNAETANKYSLYCSYYNYPALIENESERCVLGELYSCTDAKLAELDKFEGTPDLFYRKHIPVLFNAGVIYAWVYFYKDKTELKDKIKGNEWII